MTKTTNKYSPDEREHAVRMAFDGTKQYEPLGCYYVHFLEDRLHVQTLNEMVEKVELDTGQRDGVTTNMAENMKTPERENRELKQANEILRNASAYFALTGLDRPFN